MYTELDQTTKDALRASRSADAASYRAGLNQTAGWNVPKPPATPTTSPLQNLATAAKSAAPGQLAQWGREANGLASGARSLVNGAWSDSTGLGGKVLNGIGGLVAKGGAALATGGALADSADADSTDRYAKRFGVAPPTGDGSWDDLLKFAALRAGGFASDLGNRLTGGLAGRLVYQDNPGAVAAASNAAQPKSAVDTRVGNIMSANPHLSTQGTDASTSLPAGISSSPTSVNGVQRLTGAGLNSPLYTDNPLGALASYAADEARQKRNSANGQLPGATSPEMAILQQLGYGATRSGGQMTQGASAPDGGGGSIGLSVLPSTAGANGAFLRNAFNRYINSGDLEGAMRTAVTQEDHAAVGRLEAANAQAQSEAARTDPLRRLMMEALNNAANADKKVTAGLPYRKKGEAAPTQTDWAALANNIAAMLAGQKGAPQKSPMQEALDQEQARAGIQQSQQAATTAGLDQQIKAGQVRDAGQMSVLRSALINSTDPKERERLSETMQTLTGKYEKVGQATKWMLADMPYGQPDPVTGQQKTMKVPFNPETGQFNMGAAGGPLMEKQQKSNPGDMPKTADEAIKQAKMYISKGYSKAQANEMLKNAGFPQIP